MLTCFNASQGVTLVMFLINLLRCYRIRKEISLFTQEWSVCLMVQHDLPIQVQDLKQLSHNNVIKGQIDLMVLRHMAQQLRLTLLTLEPSSQITSPIVYEFTERRCSRHRIVFYKPATLFTEEELSFVGFVSGQHVVEDASIRNELQYADQDMLAQLMHIPGLLGYSSLEVQPGRWYNLVVMRNLGTMADLKQINRHQYAAYQLAPRAYSWIRIHSGIFPGGLARNAPRLLKTKHYSFLSDRHNFQMHEVVYDAQNKESPVG
jgi:hypothetical protein